MNQKYKTVYFPDYPSNTSKKSLTIAFGKKCLPIYEKVKNLSSEEIRELLIDNFHELSNQAIESEISLNTYCLKRLKKSIENISNEKKQLTFLNIDNKVKLFDPLSVTFKGGAKEPFVRWYPYLEGYSPKFVESIIRKYAPYSKTIIDPFAGTATTVFTSSQFNIKSYFCEINPLLQFISLTKIKVRGLNVLERRKLAEDMILAFESLKSINKIPADNKLYIAYHNIFRDSKFFDDSTFDKILRLRTFIDNVALENTLLADLLTIAILGSLVPSSYMKRAGDLRYKTLKEKEKEDDIDILLLIKNKIHQISNDISNDVVGLNNVPILISETAGSLCKMPCLEIDAVISSPPYLNGTNYFRNTKIELWFLKCLQEKEDLTRFRAEALTCGINDVTVAKSPTKIHPQVKNIVNQLEASAYDTRIPKMVACYFNEIAEVFEGLKIHLRKNAKVAIDIGDSCYSGVHVPVDALLTACLEDVGYHLMDSVILRKRKSRGGMLLKQFLLVFNCNNIKSKSIQKVVYWENKWLFFKSYLPHQKQPFSKRNWGHGWHSLCSYPGKMKPAIANQLINTFLPLRGKVLDPFAGVGTIPFEASLLGFESYGFEISPAAYIIAKAKSKKPNKSICNRIIVELEKYIKNNTIINNEKNEIRNFGFNGKIAEYFHSDTLREILLAKRYFNSILDRQQEHFFVEACLLHILHGNRPYALSRRSHPLTPYKPTGPFEYRSLIEKLSEKTNRSLGVELPNSFSEGKIFFQDATKWWPNEINDLDAIITSPPFFDSTRFYLANWLRLWFSGWNPEDFKNRPNGFIEEQQKKSFDIYIPIIRQARERLKKDGILVFHLGKSLKCNMADNIIRVAKEWFSSYDLFDECVTHCESHGIRDKGAVTSHQYLVFY